MAFVQLSYLDKKNLISYTAHIPSIYRATFVGLSIKDGSERRLTGIKGQVDTNKEGGRITTWLHTQDTENGLCGSVYISEGQDPAIVGIHYAGLEQNLAFGRSFMPSQEDIEGALKTFASRNTSLISSDPPLTWAPDINGKPAFVFKGDETPGAMNDQVVWLGENEHEKGFPEPALYDYPQDALSVAELPVTEEMDTTTNKVGFDKNYVFTADVVE